MSFNIWSGEPPKASDELLKEPHFIETQISDAN